MNGGEGLGRNLMHVRKGEGAYPPLPPVQQREPVDPPPHGSHSGRIFFSLVLLVTQHAGLHNILPGLTCTHAKEPMSSLSGRVEFCTDSRRHRAPRESLQGPMAASATALSPMLAYHSPGRMQVCSGLYGYVVSPAWPLLNPSAACSPEQENVLGWDLPLASGPPPLLLSLQSPV